MLYIAFYQRISLLSSPHCDSQSATPQMPPGPGTTNCRAAVSDYSPCTNGRQHISIHSCSKNVCGRASRRAWLVAAQMAAIAMSHSNVVRNTLFRPTILLLEEATYCVPAEYLKVPEEMHACGENLQRIYAAIRKFEKDGADWPTGCQIYLQRMWPRRHCGAQTTRLIREQEPCR